MKQNQLSAPNIRGCFTLALSVLVALGLLSLSAGYQVPAHPFCGGQLGAGWPVPFLCDAGSGGSPISSWGKIDFADLYLGGLSAAGFLVDFPFYLALVWAAWFLAARIARKDSVQRGPSWPVVISMGFMIGLLCALLAVLPASMINDYSPPRTPTPFVPTAAASARDQEVIESVGSRHVSLGEGEWILGTAAQFEAAGLGCGTQGLAENVPYVVFLIQGPMEVDLEIKDGSWERWVDLYDMNVALAALQTKIAEVKQRPDYETLGYVECILRPDQ